MKEISNHAIRRSILGQKRPKYDRCAVVGSSGTLLHSGLGSEIDRHDFVIRMNDAPTLGYTSDVGSRTDLMTVNSEVITRWQNQSNCNTSNSDQLPCLPFVCPSFILFILAGNTRLKHWLHETCGHNQQRLETTLSKQQIRLIDRRKKALLARRQHKALLQAETEANQNLKGSRRSLLHTTSTNNNTSLNTNNKTRSTAEKQNSIYRHSRIIDIRSIIEHDPLGKDMHSTIRGTLMAGPAATLLALRICTPPIDLYGLSTSRSQTLNSTHKYHYYDSREVKSFEDFPHAGEGFEHLIQQHPGCMNVF